MERTRELLRPSDVAPLLGVGLGRVYQLVAAGEIPAVRRGRTILIPRGAWEHWLEEQRDRALAATHSDPDTPGAA